MARRQTNNHAPARQPNPVFVTGHDVHTNNQQLLMRQFMEKGDKSFIKDYQPKYFKKRERKPREGEEGSEPQDGESLTNRTGFTEYTARSSVASTARSTARRERNDDDLLTTGRLTGRETWRQQTGRTTSRNTGREDDGESAYVDTSRTDLTIQVGALEEEKKKLEEMMAQIDARLMQSLSTARKADAVVGGITAVYPGTYRDTRATPRPGERRK
jgi:hypothetical protein